MAVWPMGPRRHWVVLGSFIPWPILWDSDISSIRVKWILLNLTLGSRDHFPPESPFIPDDRLLHVKTLKILSAVNPRTCVHRVCNSLPPSTLMDNYLKLLFFHSSPVCLVMTRYSETLVVLSIILELTALLFYVNWMPKRIILRTCRVSVRPKLFMCFTKIHSNTIRSSENPEQPIALEILACLHYG